MKHDQEILEELRMTDDATCWQAVSEKDKRFNGLFYFGVRSTGIFCKPSCPSRRPGRDHVVYFHSPEAAQASGFRACKRCKPLISSERDPQLELVMRACHAIEAQSDGNISLDELSNTLGVSSYHLQRTFKKVTGVTPRQYAASHRLEQFKSLLDKGSDVTGAIYEAGYGSSRALYENASTQLGMTPASYKKGGKGMQINYAIVDCHLGRLLIAATERGVCAVSFGDDDDVLKESLRATYDSANIVPDDGRLQMWIRELLDYLGGSQPNLDLPLDVQATAFQSRVWEELRRIPYGTTRSYGEIAKAIGQPTATRAVARACATNSVAVVIPCHRVVREDGSLSGYRWGSERKKALLEDERKRSRGNRASAKVTSA